MRSQLKEHDGAWFVYVYNKKEYCIKVLGPFNTLKEANKQARAFTTFNGLIDAIEEDESCD